MISNRKIQTLDEFALQQLRQAPDSTGELAMLLRDIGLAAKRVNVEVGRAGLVDILGDTGEVNIHGENVKKLDNFANNHFIAVTRHGISCAGIAGEENDNIIVFDDEKSNYSEYVMVIDPLDGSSNIDANVSIGSIFGIYKRISERGKPADMADFLQPGNQQVAAGYILYGSSTMLVYATELGVNGFTLDPSVGEFTLSYPDIRCPATGKIYSVNHGNFWQYDNPVRAYITACQQNENAVGGIYTQRYIGSMVADVHRNLIKGGIFMYPATSQYPKGKLRLLYECNPMAYIVEKAGGRATDGTRRILDIQPATLHERSALFLGSTKMMEDLESYCK